MAALASKRRSALTVALVVAAVVSGCAQRPKPMYHWEGYQRQLYEHFKADSSNPAEQLQILETQAEKARATGATLPPGYRAHLAMVYLRLGRDDDARRALEAEKASFPESAQYMSFILKRMQASAQ
ncbi:DUF4810 domain-containing protein [uncultured Methylibium sp.]|uniref:DUF4810 domain-containing protein n=1 Tax=uncultured Methylibium sp. TaxID=381093 RepID=UPI0025EA7AA2|nr:DUF4810 domain-containing protein [uncultured Methylibium sp.]